ncbi:MAG: NmrA family NAD(P)-binding protein, partial [Hyphomicrobium sp.]
MKVLIAGAAGYLGEHVVRAAMDAGHEVAVYVRGGTVRFPHGVRLIEGDLTDVALLQSALADVDAAIFSAGRNFQPGLPLDAYYSQNVSIVEAFLE